MNFGIIAAGEGSRLVQEGVARPKPLVDIDGRPMIERLVDIFCTLGADRISVIVNDRMPEVADFLHGLAPRVPSRLELVVKSTPSSMHSFHELGRLLRDSGRFVLTTVDTIFRADDFARYVGDFASAPADTDGMMAVTRHIDDEKPLYVETDEAMRITAFRDEAWPGARFVSGGIYGLDDRAVDVLDRCVADGTRRMRNYQRALVAAGLRLKAYDMGKIIDVDHADDIRKAREFLSGDRSATPIPTN